MALKINIGGTWKDATPWVNVGGTWKQLAAQWVNVSGTWKKIWPENVVLPTLLDSDVYSSSICTAQFQFRTDGWVYRTHGDPGGTLVQYWQWMKSGVASDYKIRAHTLAGVPGTLTSGPTTLTSLATQQVFTRQSGALDITQNVTFKIEITNAANVVLLTGNASLTAERYS